MEQLSTPMWWGELEAILGIMDLHKFAQKIRASFYVPEVWSRMSPGQEYSAPPAPRSLNRGVFLPGRLDYQDIRWWPALLTVAYCWCLQHWAEKCHLPRNPDFHPLAESVRELRQSIMKFVNITWEDVLEGLEMEEPKDGPSHPQEPYSARCWVPQPLGKRWSWPLEGPPSQLGYQGQGGDPAHSPK